MLGLSLSLSAAAAFGPRVISYPLGPAVGARGNETVVESGGVATVTALSAGAFGVSYEVAGLEIGTNYKVSISITNNTVGVVAARFDDVSSLTDPSTNFGQGVGTDYSGSADLAAIAETMYIGVIVFNHNSGETIEVSGAAVQSIT